MPIPPIFKKLQRKLEESGATTNVILKTLSLGAQDPITGWYAKSFADTTINMLIIPKGLEFLTPGCGLHVTYDSVGITDTLVHEGDWIEDATFNQYRVEAVEVENAFNEIAYYKAQLTLIEYSGGPTKWEAVDDPFPKLLAHYRKYNLSTTLIYYWMELLDTQNSITGWYDKRYWTGSFNGILRPKGIRVHQLGIGLHAQRTLTCYTQYSVSIGDVVQDASGDQFDVMSVMPRFLADRLAFYECDLEKRMVNFTVIEEYYDFEGPGGLDDWSKGTTGGCGALMPYLDASDPYSGTQDVLMPTGGFIYHGVTLTYASLQWWSVKAKAVGGSGTLTIVLTYSDMTTTTWTETLTGTYSNIDLKAHIVAGKTVSTVKFWSDGEPTDLLIDMYEEVTVN